MCKECSGNGVVYKFWVNHKTMKVADDWVYCDTCHPNNLCVYECPWSHEECEEISITEYYELLKKGYQAVYQS